MSSYIEKEYAIIEKLKSTGCADATVRRRRQNSDYSESRHRAGEGGQEGP